MRVLVGIQLLRAAAALAVLLHHAFEKLGMRFAVGAAGVDVFFVISGFIILHSLAARPMAPGAFLWNRAARIIPLYWAVTLGITALAVLAPPVMPGLQPDAWRVLASLLFIPHRNPQGDIFPLLVPGWTLNYEVFFYALAALAWAAPAAWRLRIFFGALLALVALGLAWRPENPMLATWTSGLLLQFAAGGALALGFARGTVPGRAWGVVLLAGGVAAYAGLEWSGWYSETWRFLAWGLPACCIVLGALALEPRREAAWMGALRRLGDASYSIYLLHTLVVAVMFRLVAPHSSLLFVLASLVAAVMVGLLSFRLFEQPVGRWLRGMAWPRRIAATS